MDNGDEFVALNMENPKKRKRNEADWKKNKPKHKRHSGEGKIKVDCIPINFTIHFNVVFLKKNNAWLVF